MKDIIYGRYETGIEAGQAKIKKDLPVYNNITRDEAKAVAEGMYKTSKLCSSYAWDTVIEFIGTTYATNSEGDNYTGKVENTGYHSEKNIYDIGSNAIEWTTESYTDTNYPYTARRRKFRYWWRNTLSSSIQRLCSIWTISKFIKF